MNFTEAFERVGNKNKYQYFVIAFMCFVWLDICYILLGPSYILMNPQFRCPGYEDLVSQEIACPIINQCQISNDFTLTAYAGLYCSKQFQRDLIQSSMYIGSISGLIIMNIISDKYGRKFSFLIALVTSVFGALFITIGGFIKNVALMSIAQVFLGFGGYSVMILTYIIVGDLCSDRLRQIGFMIMHSSWALAQMFFFVLYKWINMWEYFTIGFLLIPLIGWTIIAKFLLVESPVYLSIVSKSRCIDALNTIAVWNDKPLLQQSQLELQIFMSVKQIQGSVFQVFQKWQYLKIVILISIYQISTNMFYYGTQYSMDSIGSNFGVNMLIVGTLQFFAYFISNFIIDKFRRKRTLMTLNVVGGGICMFFIFKSVNHSKIVPSILVSLGRFVVNFCQGFLACFYTESFPDRMKSRGSGTIQAISGIGNIITPFIVTATVNVGLNPVFVVSVILIVGAIPLFFTKETLPGYSDNKQSLLTQEQEQIQRESIQ